MQPDPAPTGRLRTVLVAGLGLVVLLGVLLRLHSPSALWLDEAQSVGISALPVPQLFDALRQDGSPPLYYLLLHVWIQAFGTGDDAVRSLSVVAGLASLPLAYLAGRRTGGRRAGVAALLLVAANPFAVRYATETRMYALLLLLVLVLVVVADRARERPSPARLVWVSVVCGLLALTHYWALFLLAAWSGWLVCRAVRGPDRPVARRLLAAEVAGGVLFLPWLPGFLFQARHTGTPWAEPPGPGTVPDTVLAWAGSPAWPAVPVAVLLVVAAVLALWPPARDGRTAASGRVARLRRRLDGLLGRRTCAAPVLLVGAAGGLLIGLAVSRVLHSGFAPRYSTAALAPALLLAAVGVARLRWRAAAVLSALTVTLGLAAAVPVAFSADRTQARATAALLSARAQPGDLVVYCPDQLGPAVSRLLPASVHQVVYPTLGAPQRVDWVDYAQRNGTADPEALARRLSAAADGTVWLVSAPGYRTFGDQCTELAQTLAALRGSARTVQRPDPADFEQQTVTAFPAR
ncbi:glycosyltransferase family 39 protein [Nakamurella endophytica]|uniref:glycosyltransferase family 39 protein n=1 Tax=Nakamurella endophytica TaxID=1748367 RepID=UPI0016685462|nr:glycosyltransferase family 39 protein [Nakamurella endophytica]